MQTTMFTIVLIIVLASAASVSAQPSSRDRLRTLHNSLVAANQEARESQARAAQERRLAVQAGRAAKQQEKKTAKHQLKSNYQALKVLESSELVRGLKTVLAESGGYIILGGVGPQHSHFLLLTRDGFRLSERWYHGCSGTPGEQYVSFAGQGLRKLAIGPIRDAVGQIDVSAVQHRLEREVDQLQGSTAPATWHTNLRSWWIDKGGVNGFYGRYSGRIPGLDHRELGPAL